MLQANPSLTPADVKTILQYTAQPYPGYDVMTQGAGFLDAGAAITLARSVASLTPGIYLPLPSWLFWTPPDGSSTWTTDDGDTVVWGTDDGDTVVWGTSCSDPACQPVVWGR
jgi:hypothetical protein